MGTRKESDSMGLVDVDDARLWLLLETIAICGRFDFCRRARAEANRVIGP